MDKDTLIIFKWFFGLLGLALVAFGAYVRWFTYNPLFPERLTEQRSWAESSSFVFFGIALFAFVSMYLARGWAKEIEARKALNAYLRIGSKVETLSTPNQVKVAKFLTRYHEGLEEAAESGHRASRT